MRAFASVSLCVASFFFLTWEGRDGGDREEKAEGANVSESVVSHFSHLFLVLLMFSALLSARSCFGAC